MAQDQAAHHSCSHCQNLILDPSTAYDVTDPDLKSRICPCSSCQQWFRRMETTNADCFFIVLDSKSLLRARNNGCVTANELLLTWEEDDDETIDYLSRKGVPFEMTNVIAWCSYRKPNRYDIFRFEFRGPHLITVDSQPPKGDYGICYEDEFGVASVQGDPVSRFLSAREAYRKTDDVKAYQMAVEWVRQCEQDHLICQRSRPHLDTFKPARLLQVYDPKLGSSYVKIVPREHLAKSARYVALSYCWGGDQPSKTLEENIGPRLHRLKVSELQKTIQDAIKITRSLDFPYLWIDSLCIIQDNPQDLAKELSDMDKIYEYADLLVSATRARNSTEGILDNVENLSTNVSCGYRCPDGQIGVILLQRADDVDDMSGRQGVHGRCWTLQEHLLPTRILAYARSGLRWSCRTTAFFDGPWSTSTVSVNYLEDIKTDNIMSEILASSPVNGTPITVKHGQVMTLNVSPSVVADFVRQKRATTHAREGASGEMHTASNGIIQWRRLLEEFTSRSITSPADRLPAISAVAKKFNNVVPGLYIAGLWEIALPVELLWGPMGGSKKGCDQDGLFPSWSWASVYHRICWDVPSTGIVTLQCLEANLSLLYPTFPYGHVTKGSLRVRGCLVPVTCEAVDVTLDKAKWSVPDSLHNLPGCAFLVPRISRNRLANGAQRQKIVAFLDDRRQIDSLQNIFCLEVLRGDPSTVRSAYQPSAGLVLAPWDESGNAFRRIGLFGFRNSEWVVPRLQGVKDNSVETTRLDMSSAQEILLI